MDRGCWQRARSGEQIELRTKQILQAAAVLFLEEDYENVTMQKIAARAGFTRSNIYRYFRSLEEIFLTLYIADSRLWVADVEEVFTAAVPPDRFITLWIDSLKRHPRYVELTSLLALSLERNSSRDVYQSAKIAIGGMAAALVAAIRRAQPALDEHLVLSFLQTCQILVAGASPMSRRSAMQDEVLAEINMPFLKIDLFDFLKMALTDVLEGLISRKFHSAALKDT